jgi:FAD/FMN-containing dehydrogenase/Fe-S oxidoreductase
VNPNDTRDLIYELARHVTGEIRFDSLTRLLYSTDASIYRVDPIGVVLPRSAEDVVATVETAARYGVPVLPRGGGSSLAGQAVNHALVIDTSKYMHDIVEVNVEERWVRVQPGMTLDRLNAALAVHNLKYGPDPSSSNRATVGGTLGNNGTGAHSILYGMSVRQTAEVDAVLADGALAHLAPTTRAQVAALAGSPGLLGRIYTQVPGLLERYADAIHTDYPRTWRRAGGYNLDYVYPGGPNLAKLMAGSEGTLGVIVEAKLNLHLLPRTKGLVIVEFGSLVAAMEAVPAILETEPSAIELNDEQLLHMASTVPGFARKLTFIQGQPAALLVVEYYGEERSDLTAQIDGLIGRLRAQGHGDVYTPILDPRGMANVWQVRKDAVGLLMSRPGNYKPIAFIEDVAVPVDELPSFVSELKALVAEHGTEAAIYGHASAGCLHVRPLINQKDAASLAAMASILGGTVELIVAHGGALSGEHGAGRARSPFNRQIYGPRLYEAFRELKAIFDPDGLLNPGNLVDSPGPLEHLRYGPDYAVTVPETGLSYHRHLGFDGAIEMCNGQGVCRKVDAGAMCPSYQASREELHSTRGRSNVLRAAISGRLPGGLMDPAVKAALDLCLACKSCKAECPSTVDMAKLKYEVRYQAHKAGHVSRRDWLLGHVHLMNRIGTAFAPLSNWVMRLGVTRLVQHHVLGIHRARTMPAWARPTFMAWWRRRATMQRRRARELQRLAAKEAQGAAASQQREAVQLSTPPGTYETTPSGGDGAPLRSDGAPLPAETPRPGRNGPVVLFHETLTDANNPEVGRAAVKVLEAAGFEAIILEKRKCCGRPLLSKGFIDEARQHAAHNVALLAPYARQGIPIVGCEPSCMTMFQDDYRDLLPGPETELVAANTFLILEFLVNLAAEGRLELEFDGTPREAWVHSHCHERAVRGPQATAAALRLLPNLSVSEIDAGCCGMAGSFGFEREHYDFSLAVGEGRLFPALRALPPEAEVVLTGTSCRDQVQHAVGRHARHPIELIADALAT